MNNKERMIEFCDTLETHYVDHLENALENLSVLQNGTGCFVGCPDNYGLEDYKGLCYDNVELGTYNEQENNV